MKPILCITLFFITITLSAQKYYVGFQVGSGFSTNAGQANFTDINLTDTVDTYEIKAGGFGEGLYVSAHFGYRHTDFISYELGLNYLYGRTITNEENNYTTIIFGGYLNETTISQNIRTLMISPRLVFSIPSDGKVKAYAKIGMTFGGYIRANYKVNVTEIGGFAGRVETNTERVLKGGIPLGFTSSLGANYQLDDRFSLLAELNLLNMAYRPFTNTVTTYNVNGTDTLDNLTTKQRETQYSNKVTSDDGTNDNEPNRALAISLPMSNISFNVGLQINL